MASPNEAKKEEKRDEKIRNYQQLYIELQKRRGYMMKVIPLVIGCLGGGVSELKSSIKKILTALLILN